MLLDRLADLVELGLDLGKALNIVRVRDKLAVVLLVRLFGEMCLTPEVVLRGELSLAGALVRAAELDHRVLERLALLLERRALRFDLAVQVRVLGRGGGEIRRERVKAFAQAADLDLDSCEVSVVRRGEYEGIHARPFRQSDPRSTP